MNSPFGIFIQNALIIFWIFLYPSVVTVLLLVCSTGKRTYLLQNRLKHFGYTNTRILEGGVLFNTQLQGR